METIEHDLSNSFAREQTFQTWGLKYPHARAMAQAGFVQTGPGDRVECPSCGIWLDHWQEGQNPKERHMEAVTYCPVVESWGLREDDDLSVASGATGSSASSGDSGIERDMYKNPSKLANRLPGIPSESPENSTLSTSVSIRERTPRRRRAPSPPPPKYKKLEERIKSYHGVSWQSNLEAQPDVLAKAGFYYVGPADRVKCGYCGGKLKKWLPEDNPIEEHVKHFSDCSFVKTIEKQTMVLSKNMRTKSKTESCVSSEELIRQKQRERAEQTTAKPNDLTRKTLQKMGYSIAMIKTAEKRLKSAPGVPVNLQTLLAEVQIVEKESFLGEIAMDCEEEEDEGLSLELYADVIEEEAEDISTEQQNAVTQLQQQLKLAEKERDDLSQQVTCKICLTNKVDTLFLTCRHFCTCKTCADRVKDCPVCRQVILGTVDVFMA